ncbi:MAG: PqqD family protein [Clostridia bacterium]|nr:PqqD family protein [Clostridia bacterium]
MRLKDGFLLRKVAGEYIVVPTGDSMVDFKAMISLNETGAFLWEQLTQDKTEQQLLQLLLSEYDVDEETATLDITEFLNLLKDKNLLV